MQDRKWVFTQKQRNSRVAGRTVGGVVVLFSFLFSLPPSLRSAPGGASSTPRGSEGNLRAVFVQRVYG